MLHLLPQLPWVHDACARAQPWTMTTMAGVAFKNCYEGFLVVAFFLNFIFIPANIVSNFPSSQLCQMVECVWVKTCCLSASFQGFSYKDQFRFVFSNSSWAVVFPEQESSFPGLPADKVEIRIFEPSRVLSLVNGLEVLKIISSLASFTQYCVRIC